MFHYRIADNSPDDVLAWHRLRTDVYLDEGLITVDQLTDGLYRDQYDDYSIRIVATDADDNVVAVVRLIEGRLGSLQVHDQFGVVPGPDSLEVSGCAVARSARGSAVTIGLYRALLALSAELDYRQAYFEVEEPFLSALLELGLPLRRVGEPRFVFNATNIVAMLDIPELVPALRSADIRRNSRTRIGEYFASPFQWTLSSSDIVGRPEVLGDRAPSTTDSGR